MKTERRRTRGHPEIDEDQETTLEELYRTYRINFIQSQEFKIGKTVVDIISGKEFLIKGISANGLIYFEGPENGNSPYPYDYRKKQN